MLKTSAFLENLLKGSAIQKQSEAYALSFIIENSLRVSMHNVMVKQEGVGYFTETIFPPFKYDKYSNNEINAVKIARERKKVEQEVGFKKAYERHHLWYLDYPILVALIDLQWDKYFCLMFEKPGKIKADVLYLFDKVILIRNSIAHHRYVSDTDLQELRSLKDFLDAILKADFMNNFSELVLNPAEYVIENTIELMGQIKNQIDSHLCIPNEVVLRFRSAISACEPFLQKSDVNQDIDKLIMDLWKYNGLPRIPGGSAIVAQFVKESAILLKLSKILQSLEMIK